MPGRLVAELARYLGRVLAGDGDALRARIRAEIAEIDRLPELARAEALLVWSTDAAVIALDEASYVAAADEMDADRLWRDVFAQPAGGVSCGGAARFYRNILALFGVEAFTVNFGIPQSALTHVTTVVPQAGAFYVFDATFGLTFESGGEAADISAILDGTAQVRELPDRRRRYIASAPGHPLCRTSAQRTGDFWVCGIGDGSFLHHQLGQWRCAEYGLARDTSAFGELMRRGFFDIGDSFTAPNAFEFAERLHQWGIPLHPHET